MFNKPTLIMVPGSWHRPETWDKVRAILEEQQYNCIPIILPTTTGNASLGFADDVKVVSDSIQTEISAKRNVILVVHSYGGAVGVSAIKGFTRPKSGISSRSETGHVLGVAMIATGFGPSGQTFLDGVGGQPPPTWSLDPTTGFATIAVPARDLFYHDLPTDEGEEWVSNLTPQSSKAFTTGADVAYAGWMDVPVWFLETVEDRGLPVQAQQMMVGMAKEAGADVTVREIASSHSPMLSRPKETATFITDAVAAFTVV
ncbi:alpha/beta-hydrolase [Aulographum hederae CBS 113979]|uniref:Alpha/beta-hydrolase n=1 Tax=Aulographum hederae CBS 113979 TaxID=1176131 RepID=A0A6G1GYE7_9PEZI|nr:alpha/beta-hydrolase [Aulographum hederae CBS 113979]